MNTVKSIDWITGTFTSEIGEVVNIVPDWLKIGEQIRPVKPFDKAFALKPAGTYALSAANTMCKMIQLTGSEMAAVRDKAGITDKEILSHFCQSCNNITRIDYAIDVFDAGWTPANWLQKWQDGKLKTRLRTVQNNETLTGFGGQTVYFGSEKSDQRIRIYDKGAQQKLLEVAWNRVELQCRKKRATPLAHDMLREGIPAAGDTRMRELLKLSDVDESDAMQSFMSGADATLTSVPRKESNWQKWMNEQVRKSIQNHSMNEEDRFFMYKWLEDVTGDITTGFAAQVYTKEAH